MLLRMIEKFLNLHAMPPTTFGRACVRDPRLVSDLRGGREPGRRLICRTEHFMNKWRADRHAGHVAPQGDRRTRAVRQHLETGAGA